MQMYHRAVAVSHGTCALSEYRAVVGRVAALEIAAAPLTELAGSLLLHMLN